MTEISNIDIESMTIEERVNKRLGYDLPIYLNISNEIRELLIKTPKITPREVRHIIDEKYLKNPQGMTLNFCQASTLDHIYFNKIGGSWVSDFNFPEENDILEFAGKKFIATNVGIFTFYLEQLNEEEQHNHTEKKVIVEEVELDEEEDEEDEEDEYDDYGELNEISEELAKIIEDELKLSPNLKPHEIGEKIMSLGLLEKPNILCFGNAQMLDYKFFGLGGRFWRGAYNFPKENEEINFKGKIYIAKNVGIFTFEREDVN